MKTLTCSLAAVGLLALIGCNNSTSGYTPQPTETKPPVDMAAVDTSTFLPLREGNQWTYDVTTIATNAAGQRQTQQEEVTLRVVESREEGGATRAQMEFIPTEREERMMLEDPNLRDNPDLLPKRERTGWMVDSSGIFQTAAPPSLSQFDPPVPSFVFEMKPGDKREMETVGPRIDQQRGPMTITLEMLGPLTADTKTGELQVIGTKTTMTFIASADGQAPAPISPNTDEEESSSTSTDGEGEMTTDMSEMQTEEGASAESSEEGAATPAPGTVVTISTVYWAPGVGIARFVQENRYPNGARVVQTLRLKDYDVK